MHPAFPMYSSYYSYQVVPAAGNRTGYGICRLKFELHRNLWNLSKDVKFISLCKDCSGWEEQCYDYVSSLCFVVLHDPTI